jgi:hypothetical protein
MTRSHPTPNLSFGFKLTFFILYIVRLLAYNVKVERKAIKKVILNNGRLKTGTNGMAIIDDYTIRMALFTFDNFTSFRGNSNNSTFSSAAFGMFQNRYDLNRRRLMKVFRSRHELIILRL